MASTINASTSAGLVNTADTSGVLQLQTAGTTAVTVDASQNVGIGTASPSQKLSINGRLNFAGFSANIDDYGIWVTSAEGTTIASYSTTNIAFRTNGTERMRIDSSGKLLIGMTSYSGFANGAALYSDANGAVLNLGHTTGSGSGSGFVLFGYNNGGIGSITQNGTTAVAYNTTSDYRLKENVVPMTGALDTVAQLKPVTYKWKADGSSGQGFIAHELQAVVPDCVTGQKDAVDAEGKPVYQGIDTSFLVATLTCALQELKAIVDTQATTIAALQANVSALTNK